MLCWYHEVRIYIKSCLRVCMPQDDKGVVHPVFHDPLLEEMWGLLRASLMFFMRPYPQDMSLPSREARREAWLLDSRAAYEKLRKYARLAERHFGPLLCKHNLHALLCRLQRQQEQRGHAAWFLELWVEQNVQLSKRDTRDRSTGAPHLIVVGRWCLRLALQCCRAEYPTCRSSEERKAEGLAAGGQRQMAGSLLDRGDATGEGFLGTGRLYLSPERQAECEAALLTFWKEFQGSKPELAVAEAHLVLYCRVQLAGAEIIHSHAYLRPKTRRSHYVYLTYVEQGRGVVKYVADIKYFVGAMEPGTDPYRADGTTLESEVGISLRLAIADLHEVTVRRKPWGNLLEVADSLRPAHSGYPVQVGVIHSKLVKADLQKTVAGSNAHPNRWFFVQCHLQRAETEP